VRGSTSIGSRRVARAFGVAALAWLFGAVAAGATTYPLDVEFDDGLTGSFGTLEVSEVTGGDLLFEISLNPVLSGFEADLHELYFNLSDAFTGVSITSSDVVSTPYELEADPSVAGGAGSSFAYAVNFGDGGGAPGNGALQSASFVLRADGDLTLADLLVPSSTKQDLALYFAAHVQSTSLTRSDSETLGARVPEAGTLSLGALALLGVWRARRASRRPR
jgi:hypothetical protein